MMHVIGGIIPKASGIIAEASEARWTRVIRRPKTAIDDLPLSEPEGSISTAAEADV
jgi:hypothetical protein